MPDHPAAHVAEVDDVLFRVGVSDQRRNYLSARPQTSRLADLCEVRVQQLLELLCGASDLGCEQGEFAFYNHCNLVIDHLMSFPRGALRRLRSSVLHWVWRADPMRTAEALHPGVSCEP